MVGKNVRSAKFLKFYKQNGTFWKHLHFTIFKKIKVYITIHRTCFIHISQKILPLFHISQCFSGGIHNSQDKSWSQFHSFFCSISQNHKPREAISQFTKTVSPPIVLIAEAPLSVCLSVLLSVCPNANSSQTNGPINFIFGGKMHLISGKVLIYFSWPWVEYQGHRGGGMTFVLLI